jgi:O-antigen ligase
MVNPIALIPGANWKHPNPRLQSAWDWARVGFVIFPLLPSVGAVVIFTALVKTWRQAGREIIAHRLNWGFALLTPWLIVVSILGRYPGDAALGLANFLPFFCFFAAYSTLIQSPEQLRQLAWIFTLPCMPVMLLGLGQMFLGWGGILPIPGVPAIIWELHPGGEPLGRMSSLFAHANPLAVYLQIVFIFALGLLVDTYNRNINARKDNSIVVPNRIWKSPAFLWLLALLAISVLSLILTSSRSAWSVMMLSSLVFTIYQSWYWIVGIVTAIATVILSAAYAPSPLKEPLRSIVPFYFWGRITDDMYPNRPTEITRIELWKFAWKMTQSRPITGWGLQSFGPLYQDYAHTWLGHPHNLLLTLSSNLGIPTAIGLFGLVGWILVQGTLLFLNFPIQWRSEQTIFFTYLVAFAGLIVTNIADATFVELRLNTHAWLILSSICGLVYSTRSSLARPDRLVAKDYLN